MLIIKNIGKIVGMYANGRHIVEAGDFYDQLRKDGKEYFVFKIQKQKDGLKYNSEHDVVLSKGKNVNGRYRMFNMGFRLATEIEVDMKDIKQPQDFCIQIRNVLVKTQTYYQTN